MHKQAEVTLKCYMSSSEDTTLCDLSNTLLHISHNPVIRLWFHIGPLANGLDNTRNALLLHGIHQNLLQKDATLDPKIPSNPTIH
jgi:hypothetical protein